MRFQGVPDFRNVAEPFERQAELTPDAVALVEGTQELSYRELNEAANRLARCMREAHQIVPGRRVAVFLGRSIAQVVSIYAAVKAGATYVPIDPGLPDGRISAILTDAAPHLVLVDEARQERSSHIWQGATLRADEPPPEGNGSDRNLALSTSAGSVMHLLYTSGTTGQPKGVATPAGSPLANIAWMQYRYPYNPGDTALYKSSPGFDISIWELFWPLFTGARVVVADPGTERSPRLLAEQVADHKVSLLFLTPTQASLFLDETAIREADALRWVICGGEPMDPQLPARFRGALPWVTLVNAFGPTEAGPVTDNIISAATSGVPVGQPADNFTLRILDEHLRSLPTESPGEVYIGGAVGLADGYWRSAAQTAAKFVADPVGPAGARLYRTGDLGALRGDGALVHLGRADRQLKIRGVRVEPGEIEGVISEHPLISTCVVVPDGPEPRLYAFAVTARGATGQPEPTALAQLAAQRLPPEMRPARIMVVSHLPTRVNSKIDTDELLRWMRTAADHQHVAPADDLERQLVAIYGNVLGRPDISMIATFSDLGGHSLLAIRLVEQCEEHFALRPDIDRVLTGSVREIAAAMRTGQTTATHEQSRQA